ncbi:MAG: type VI secretion system-associated FHA domain protein TagH [Burkholderiales bacterium]|nr:type VI secretion system-associated FHA domain protein TagH [Burkholderiales bacterium]
MGLTLQAVALNDQPLTQPIVARFDANGGTIGRADHNTMALPDPERHISRLQAEVFARGNGYMVRNVGSANPIIVGGRAVGQGETAALLHGDAIRIGAYLLQVDSPPSDATVALQPAFSAPQPARTAAPVPPPVVPAPSVAIPAAPAGGNPFADLLGGEPATDTAFSALLQPSLPARTAPGFEPAAPAGIAADSRALIATPPPPAPLLPPDFDFFDRGRAPAAAPPAPAGDPFAELGFAQASAPIEAVFGIDDGAGHLARFTAAPSPGAGTELPTDPLELFGAPAPPAPPAGPTQADAGADIHAAFAPPAVASPVRGAPPPAQAPRTAAGDDAVWAAFCAGAGVDLPLPPGELAPRMQLVGALLNRAVAGMLQLMAVRASTKHEMRAEVTVIRQVSNNPLKFSPDAKAGIEQLVQPPSRGFLDGAAAVDDAMHDLVGHSIGTVAGMRAALEGLLDRFDPAALEARLAPPSRLESLLPGQRKSRLWDEYLRRYGEIRGDAQEDFHSVFGKAFVAAYEQQVERLKRGER